MTLYRPSHNQLQKLDEILGSLEGRRIGLLGLGVAGRAMASYLLSRGAQVIAADLRAELADDETLSSDLQLRLGEMSEATFADVEALVISPGAHPGQPAVEAVRKADGEAPSIEIMSALANAYGGFLVDLLGRKAAVSLMRGHADHIEKLEDSGITDGKH